MADQGNNNGNQGAAAGRLEFTRACTFTRAQDGSVTVEWNNGNAVQAVRGASIDYVSPVYHMCVTFTNNVASYAPGQDLAHLIANNVDPIMAMIVVGMRKVCLSFPGATINLAETHAVAATDAAGVVPADSWNLLQQHFASYKLALDMAPTIMGMNGLSLMLKGHNYLDSDSMWTRLEAACALEDNLAPLNLGDFAGTLYHDALHAIDAEWKVGMVAAVNSALVGHVNGVLLKRMPGIPAGTTLVFVAIAALKEISLARGSIEAQIDPLIAGLEALATRIRASPLDWCTVFQRAHTSQNLSEVAQIEPLAAFVYGMCTKIFEKKVSLLKSQAFKNNASRHVGMSKLGADFGSTLEAPEMGDNELGRLFGNLFVGPAV